MHRRETGNREDRQVADHNAIRSNARFRSTGTFLLPLTLPGRSRACTRL